MAESSRDMREQGDMQTEATGLSGECAEPRCAHDADAWRRVNLALWRAFSQMESEGKGHE